MNLLDFTEVKVLIDHLLSDYFQEQKQAAKEIHDNYVRLWQATEETALAGGKRLRPYLFLLSYQAFGREVDKHILQASLSWELLHIAMLIHDDIIDRDFYRHGAANVAGLYQEHYKLPLKSRHEDVVHFANSSAILAGDILLTAATNLSAQAELPVGHRSVLNNYLQRAIFEVAGGELIDVESSFLPIGNIDAEVVSRYKTSGYSFVGPIVSGAALAGASDDQLLILTNLSELCGYAFQLRDDVISVFGNEQETGKSTTSDIEEGKRTKLLLSAYTKTDEAGRKLLESLGSIKLEDEDIEKVRQLLITTGAKEEVVQLIHECSSQALELLDELQIDDTYRQIYSSLILKLTGRDA